jgi:hypothetical protein
MHRAALETFSLTFGRIRGTNSLVELFTNAPMAKQINA